MSFWLESAWNLTLNVAATGITAAVSYAWAKRKLSLQKKIHKTGLDRLSDASFQSNGDVQSAFAASRAKKTLIPPADLTSDALSLAEEKKAIFQKSLAFADIRRGKATYLKDSDTVHPFNLSRLIRHAA